MLRTISAHRVLVACALAALVAAACAGSSTTILSKVGASVGGAPAAASAAGSAAPAYGLGSGSESAGGTGNLGGGDNGSNAAFRDDAKIVRTGTMSLQVDDLATAVRTARDAIRAMGGYVAGSRQTNSGDQSVAEITYRIPSDRWDDSLDAIRNVARKLIDEQTNSVEVTGQLIDLEARIANLRASEKAFQLIAEKATKISDIIEVQNQLSNVRGQIEQLDAQRSHLSDEASFGTISVTYGVEVKAVTEAAKGWNAGEEVDRATASLVDVLQAVTSAGIWFAIVWFPILLMIAVVVAIGAFVLRRTGVIRKDEPPAPAPAA